MTDNPPKKLTALYIRASTLEQKSGIESQARALKEWAQKNSVLNFEYFTDEGISGAKESRPALNRLMKMVDDGEIEQVVVFAFSRFARSTTHLLKALQIFRDKNVRFLSITESLDTNSAMGVALLTILGALSQLERELIVERVRAGMKNAKAKGKPIGRKKQRDSYLIRKLLKSGLSFRRIAEIAKCSHGSISAEKAQMLKEENDALLNKECDQSSPATTDENSTEEVHQTDPSPDDDPPPSPKPTNHLRLV